ncbi:MAG: branched-chain-amino-acid transaminase [Phycisphaerales bacterium]
MTTAPVSRKAPMPESPVVIEDKPLIWIDGEMFPKHEAKISVYDHGLLYGDGVFEGIRFYNGRIFKSMSHLERIYRNAEAIRINIPYSKDEMHKVMHECIRANGLKDGYIRLIVTRGVGTLGLDYRKCPKAGVICIADKIALYPPEMYENGMRVVVAKRPRTPTACLDPKLKSLNYLNNVLAKMEAIDAGCLEVIMLSTEGFVGECSGDNLFTIKNGVIYTAPIETGMLDGITRSFVIKELAPKLGLKVEEKWMKVEDVKASDEIFLTGTAAEVIAVTQVDDTVIGSGKEGPLTRKLRAAFKEVVSADAPEN